MTLKDIAEITGFSVITVSRVLRNPEKVKKETREIIEKAIKEFNYTPNLAARALVTKRTNVIYLYVPEDLEHTHPFVSQLISGITSYVGEEGYSLLVRNKWYENEAVDGLILVGLTIEDETKLEELDKKIPLVVFGHNELVDWVDVDNYQGSYMMTDYVIKRGYKKVHYIGIEQNKKFTKDRLKGHKNALIDNNLKELTDNVILVENKEHYGYEKTLEILTNNPNVEIIICASDFIAIGAMRAAGKMGIKIPEQLSITGFDGLGYELLTTPNLTTIRQPIYQVGQVLAKQIITKINFGELDPKTIYYKPKLVVNATVK